MKIYHYHPESGVFLGQGVADESPLEPGVWLIPASATDEPPPEVSDGLEAVMTEVGWQLQAIPEPEPAPIPEPVPALTPAEKLAAAGLSVDDLKELLGL